jgi:hypothetical protein
MSQTRTELRTSHDRPTILTLFLCALLILLCYLPLGCAVSPSSASSPLQKQQTAASTGILPAQFFGLVVRDPAAQPSVAAGSRRLADSGVSWAAIEPAQGVFVWAMLDQEVAIARQSGVQLMLTLGSTPTWAQSANSSMPAQLSAWDAYVQAVATRYRGQITAYELWNSPEDPANWSGDPAQLPAALATLAAHAASVLAATDPSAQLVSPVLSISALQQFLASGGGVSVQIIGASLITAGQPPEAMAALLQSIHAATVGTAADGKPVWNDQPSWQLAANAADPATQAMWVARALILNAGFGVQRLHWYAWDNHTPGTLTLTDTDGQPTVAALAYATVQTWLQGAQLNGCDASPNGLWTCQIVRPGPATQATQTTQWILWSPGSSIQASALGAAKVTDLSGNQTTVDASGMISVGPSPILLQ